MAYDNYANTVNICRRNIETFGSAVKFERYPISELSGEVDYTATPTVFTVSGLFHSGTGKMGSATAIRFAYTTDIGAGIGLSDTGVLVLYDENNLPRSGDICYLRDNKFYVRVITDILAVHKVLDISLEIVGFVSA